MPTVIPKKIRFKNWILSLFQDSLNDTYGDLKVPVPMTLIHHYGHRLTTRQILSMESLREVIRKHEKVPYFLILFLI